MFARRKNFVAYLYVFLCALLLAGCGAKAERREFSDQNPPLEVSSNKFVNIYDKQVVEAEVRNVSGGEIEGAQAVVEFLSASDRLLDLKIQDLATMPANLTAKFTVEHPTEYRSEDVTQHRVRFRFKETRQAIPHRDLTGQQPAQQPSHPQGGTGEHLPTADPGGSGGALVAPTGGH